MSCESSILKLSNDKISRVVHSTGRLAFSETNHP